MPITKYLNLITSEHYQQPNFMSWLSSILQIVDDDVTMTSGMPNDFSVDNAIGVQLDTLGQIIGAKRQTGINLSSGTSILDDSHMRMLLEAQIAKNQWDGTIPGIYNLWSIVFPDQKLLIIDNQDMTMDAVINGWFDSVAVDLIAAGLIIPKPMGVSITIIPQYTLFDSTSATDSISSFSVTPGAGQIWGNGRKWGQGHWYPPTQYVPPSGITTKEHEFISLSDSITANTSTPPYKWGERKWGQGTYST